MHRALGQAFSIAYFHLKLHLTHIYAHTLPYEVGSSLCFSSGGNGVSEMEASCLRGSEQGPMSV